MTLPASGLIRVSDINTEIGYASNRGSAFDDALFLLLRGNANHPIKLSDFYNKCNRQLTAAVGAGSPPYIGVSDGYSISPMGSLAHLTDPVHPNNVREIIINQFDSLSVAILGTLAKGYFSTITIGSISGAQHTTWTVDGTTSFSSIGGTSVWGFQPLSNVLRSLGAGSYYVFIN